MYWGAALAACEMIRSGVVAFNDHYFYMDRVADAIAQLNLAHQTVLVFRSTEAEGRIAVVYRRDDGKYGLIETPAMA